jgi:hypothetical protein
LVCPLRANPTDFFMKILSVNYPKAWEDNAKIEAILDHYEKNLKKEIVQEAIKSSYFTPDLDFQEESKLKFF